MFVLCDAALWGRVASKTDWSWFVSTIYVERGRICENIPNSTNAAQESKGLKSFHGILETLDQVSTATKANMKLANLTGSLAKSVNSVEKQS